MDDSIFRFNSGDNIYVIDGTIIDYTDRALCSQRNPQFNLLDIRPATIKERHYHLERHPAYPHGEGYTLDGELWWDCYPGSRVFQTKEEAEKRLPFFIEELKEEFFDWQSAEFEETELN